LWYSAGTYSLIGSWIRDLTVDGVEPNPGPLFWEDIEKVAKERYGSDFDNTVQDALDKLRDDMRARYDIQKPKPIPAEVITTFFKDGGISLLQDFITDCVAKLEKGK
jgi:hypothetical protein